MSFVRVEYKNGSFYLIDTEFEECLNASVIYTNDIIKIYEKRSSCREKMAKNLVLYSLELSKRFDLPVETILNSFMIKDYKELTAKYLVLL